MGDPLFSPQRYEPHESSGDHYLSISDLMSGLVLVLCLMVVVFAVQYKENEDLLKQKEARLRDVERELQALRAVRRDIILGLQETFRAENIDAEIDPRTGDVSIKESLLFAVGKYKLNADGVSLLNRLVPTYSRVIFSRDEFKSAISHISIEGHASRDGEAVQNMSLSVSRAAEVYRFINDQLGYGLDHPLVQTLLIAGRGELEANQSFDRGEDRRVVFRFRFKSDEQALDILQRLDQHLQSF
jgi:outer membrane protein OmpA-like peptidoglycan-associated protein